VILGEASAEAPLAVLFTVAKLSSSLGAAFSHVRVTLRYVKRRSLPSSLWEICHKARDCQIGSLSQEARA